MSASVTFLVPGAPTGKGRPRFNRQTGRTYTPSKTQSAEARVREAWMQAGRLDLGDGPLEMHLVVVVARPGSHFRVNGDLNAAGLRATEPTRTPDLDNVLKLVSDALNQLAYRDDRQVVCAHLRRRWALPGEREHLRVTLGVFEAPGLPERDEADPYAMEEEAA